MLTYTPDFDLESIPWDTLKRHYKSRIGRMARGKAGRPMSCGHTEFIDGCRACKRKQKRDELKARAYVPVEE